MGPRVGYHKSRPVLVVSASVLHARIMGIGIENQSWDLRVGLNRNEDWKLGNSNVGVWDDELLVQTRKHWKSEVESHYLSFSI